jgi:hypothetical protein
MIHHFSIAAHDPERVAAVLAEVIGGQSLNFSPFPGSRIVVAGDAHGTAIEVYPLGLELAPGAGEAPVQGLGNSQPSEFTATHAAISVALDETSIKAIAEREGWRALVCPRTVAFSVIEFWLENRLMIEFLTPAMAEDYLRAISLENLEETRRRQGGESMA